MVLAMMAAAEAVMVMVMVLLLLLLLLPPLSGLLHLLGSPSWPGVGPWGSRAMPVLSN
jgi:hypothetical protein